MRRHDEQPQRLHRFGIDGWRFTLEESTCRAEAERVDVATRRARVIYNGIDMSFDDFEAMLRKDYPEDGDRLCWIGTHPEGHPMLVCRDGSLFALMCSDEFGEIAYAYAVHKGRAFDSYEELRAFGARSPEPPADGPSR